MKKMLFVLLTILAVASFATAQLRTPTSDILGAHLNYGRGCAACHAPHSGAWGNGANKSGDTTTGNLILWGQDVGPLYGQTITTGQTDRGTFTETFASTFDMTRPDTTGTLTCLSCHDGNLATGAMMKNQVYETLPSTYGVYNNVPTLLGKDGNSAGDYLNDHPVGLSAYVSCGTTYTWDCTNTAGVISMTGTNSAAFVTNYGFFVDLQAYNNQATVQCTSCHDQHKMSVVNVKDTVYGTKTSGLPEGNYATMFFIRAPYNPASTTAGSNQTAQFCRQCHGYDANESNGGLTIPTVF